MYTHILNYGVRAAMIIVGLLMVLGVFSPPRQDASLMRMMGIVMILFGVYRMAMYYTKQQRRHDEE
ncbi:MAG: hypothetical protein V4642_07440 [Bacteroidota bacterium]